jgi:tetratricopeptide (TPR) repeat protein
MRPETTLLLPLLLLLACSGPSEPPPSPAVAAMNRGIAQLEFLQPGSYELALPHFEEAVRLAPDWTDAKVNLAVAVLNTQKDPERVIQLCAGILEDDPLNPHANFLAGVRLYFSGRADEGLPRLDKVLEVDPDDAATHYWRARCLYDLERKEDAAKAIEEALRLDPYMTSAYSTRHRVFMHLKKRDEAKEAMATKKALEPPSGEQYPAFGNLITGKSYHEFGKYAMLIRDHRGFPEASVGFRRPESESLAAFAYGGGEGAEFTATNPEPGEPHRDHVRKLASRIGPGVVLGDYDGDGDEDVFLPQWDGSGTSIST